MYAIASKKSGELAYWIGGEYFETFSEVAVRFYREIDAENTIPILLSAGFADDMHVVELSEDM